MIYHNNIILPHPKYFGVKHDVNTFFLKWIFNPSIFVLNRKQTRLILASIKWIEARRGIKTIIMITLLRFLPMISFLLQILWLTSHSMTLDDPILLKSSLSTLIYNLSITAPSTIYIGQLFSIEIDTVDATPPLLISTTSLSLICDGKLIDSWTSVLINIPITLTLTYNTAAQQNCVFETPLTVDNSHQSVSVSEFPK